MVGELGVDVLIGTVRDDVQSLMTDRLYHNFSHVESVASEVVTLSDFSHSEVLRLQVAGYYHDVGYCHGLERHDYCEGGENHEQRSADIARERLEQFNYPDSFITDVERIILDTEFLAAPETRLGAYLSDADVASFGADFKRFKQTRKRAVTEVFPDMDYGRMVELTVEMLESHEFHTEQAKEKYGEGKERNLEMFREELSTLS